MSNSLYERVYAQVLAALVLREDALGRCLGDENGNATRFANTLAMEARAVALQVGSEDPASPLVSVHPVPPGSSLHILPMNPSDGWVVGEWWDALPLFAWGVRADGEVLPLTFGSNPLVTHAYEPSGAYLWGIEDSSGKVTDAIGKTWPSLAEYKANLEPMRLERLEREKAWAAKRAAQRAA